MLVRNTRRALELLDYNPMSMGKDGNWQMGGGYAVTYKDFSKVNIISDTGVHESSKGEVKGPLGNVNLETSHVDFTEVTSVPIHDYSRPLYDRVKKWTLRLDAITGIVMLVVSVAQGLAFVFVTGTQAGKVLFFATFIWLVLYFFTLLCERLFGRLARVFRHVFSCLARQIITF